VGEIGDTDKSEFLGNALALLFPVHWPEPFGLAMIEAMACGTPVIAWNYGSVPEVIEHGVSGYIVDSEAAALSAIARIGQIDRHGVRAVFERRYTAIQMAHAYLDVYSKLLRPRGLLRRAS
jgi:glycosyltransferase involved in cell wall biosynthesis